MQERERPARETHPLPATAGARERFLKEEDQERGIKE